MTPIVKANRHIAQRYIDLLKDYPPGDPTDITAPAYLISMCRTLIEQTSMYDDKHSRWLGCVQGIMLANGMLTRDRERDLTRPLFHQAYQEMGMPVPESIQIDLVNEAD